MKRVRINQGTVGVVSKSGDYQRVITAGKHWLGFSETVFVYEMEKIFEADSSLNIMLQDEQFKSLTEVIDLKENEIALRYEDGYFKSILASNRYFYWKGLVDFSFKKIDLSKPEITEDIDFALLQSHKVAPFTRTFLVEPFEEGLLFIDGKYVKKLSKGTFYFWRNLTTVELKKVDLRQLQLELSGQEILTKDKAALRINFHAQYQVIDSEKAILNNKDFEKQLYILIQLALREFVGMKTLDELLESKDDISEFVLNTLEKKVAKLGVKILSAGIRDVILPGEMKEIMNKVLIAQKQAQANTIMRREETASTRSLLNTAKLMEDNEMLFRLKEMEYIEKIADRIGEITVSGNGGVIDQLKDVFSRK